MPSSTKHNVQPGETLESIADEYGVTPAELRAANRDVLGSRPVVRIGQALVVPMPAAGEGAPGSVQPTGTPATPAGSTEEGANDGHP